MPRPSPFIRHVAAFTDAMGVENAPFVMFMARIPWPSDEDRDGFIKGLTGKEPRVYRARVPYAQDPTPSPSPQVSPQDDIGGGDWRPGENVPMKPHTSRPIPMPPINQGGMRPYYDVSKVKPGKGKRRPPRVTTFPA